MRCFCLFFLLFTSIPAAAQERFLLRDKDRVLFLGDSNTFAGLYVAYLDAYLTTRFPEQRFELINLGLPSETISGLSEPDHPYPRPNIHDRLDQALAKTKPTIVFACYGMNDGIYYPFSEDRLAKYQAGITLLVEKVKKTGARIVLMTPAPFDPLPIKKNARPLGEPKYSWMKPYEAYDETLAKYAAWLVTLRDKGMVVVDAHSRMRGFLKEVRKKEPDYFLSGDGIHPNATGHALVAAEILRTIHAPEEVDMAEVDFRMMRGVNGQVKDVKVADGGIQFTWTTKIPLALDPRWHNRFVELEKIKTALNRHELIVTRAPFKHYALNEGADQIGEVNRDEIKIGLDMTRFAGLSVNKNAAELLKLVEQRERLLGLAWLSDVGHMRPDTPKGLPLDQAQKQAAKLETRIRELSQPRAIKLRLTPVAD